MEHVISLKRDRTNPNKIYFDPTSIPNAYAGDEVTIKNKDSRESYRLYIQAQPFEESGAPVLEGRIHLPACGQVTYKLSGSSTDTPSYELTLSLRKHKKRRCGGVDGPPATTGTIKVGGGVRCPCPSLSGSR